MTRKSYNRVRLGKAQTVRPFEPIEDELITDHRLAGLGTTVIARELDRRLNSRRSPATINMRLKTLAARDEADL